MAVCSNLISELYKALFRQMSVKTSRVHVNLSLDGVVVTYHLSHVCINMIESENSIMQNLIV